MRILEAMPAPVLLLLACLVVSAQGDAFSASPRMAFAPRPDGQQVRSSLSNMAYLAVRGGATLAMEEDTDDEEEFEDKEEEKEEIELDASLAASALKSTTKTKTKASSSKSATVKKTMSAKLATKKPKKKGSLLKFLRVPYIVRACLNPFTVLSMTKHFWLSLVNLEYPPKDVSQDLRSSLDDKARKAGGAPAQARGKRKMKRGQAKTLSDLPQLNT